MLETAFSTEDLAAADQLGYLRELYSTAPAAMDARRDRAAGIRLQQRDLHLDALRVWTMEYEPMSLHRTAQLIRRTDPESYNICVVQRGTMSLAWDRREAVFRPGDLYTMDFSRPFDLHADNPDGMISCVGVEVPKRLVAVPRERADQVVGRPIAAGDGVGSLLAQYLIQLTSDTTSYRADDGPRLAVVATGLVSALYAHILGAGPTDDHSLPPESSQRSLVWRVRAFIQWNLDDPHLSPRTIAAAHHISLSYLHRLFQDEDVTVAALIRRERMERARRDLADRTLHATPIHAIASRWGFPRAADFTRAFRTAYGMPPKDYRHSALRTE
jgi:AraC-like DNA-binding protein